MLVLSGLSPALRAGDFYASGKPVALEFKGGAGASMIGGSLRGTDEQLYTFVGKKEQTFILSFNSDVPGSLEPRLLTPNGMAVKMAFDGRKSWTSALPASGAYKLLIGKITVSDKPVRFRGFVSLQ